MYSFKKSPFHFGNISVNFMEIDMWNFISGQH